MNHPYESSRGDKSSSEAYHLKQLDHFRTKRSAERFRKTPAEKIALAIAIRRYPNRNHRPVPPNN